MPLRNEYDWDDVIVVVGVSNTEGACVLGDVGGELIVERHGRKLNHKVSHSSNHNKP